MRQFTNLSALPGHTIVIDGEAYNCPDLVVQDMQGSVRKVPADRILAIQWHGAHNHGSIEGYGAMEGFADKSQLAPYVKAWLRARANAKADKVDALVRQQRHMDEAIATNEKAMDGLKSDIAAENDQDRITVNRAIADRIAIENGRLKAQRPTIDQVAEAQAEALAAVAEANTDA